MKRPRSIFAAAAFLLYVGTYIGLSRHGYTEAKQRDAPGFYYLTPEDTRRWEILNGTCRILFAPPNYLDRLLGFGMEPAYPPIFHISLSFPTNGNRLD